MRPPIEIVEPAMAIILRGKTSAERLTIAWGCGSRPGPCSPTSCERNIPSGPRRPPTEKSPGLTYLVTGSTEIACGEPRFTNDIDIVVGQPKLAAAREPIIRRGSSTAA